MDNELLVLLGELKGSVETNGRELSEFRLENSVQHREITAGINSNKESIHTLDSRIDRVECKYKQCPARGDAMENRKLTFWKKAVSQAALICVAAWSAVHGHGVIVFLKSLFL